MVPSNIYHSYVLPRLHNEILDFHDFVSPTTKEHQVRFNLVDRVQNALGENRFPYDTGRIFCFGSFPAGLYLPTADMDLVYTSDKHYNGGPKCMDFSSRSVVNSTLRKAARRLEMVNMASNILCITKARVPIIKFVDRLTNIHVDISFENMSGVQAQATFQKWKAQYPDLIYMVVLVKQFLVMRSYNEVHTGGIGGFSIICLIVSYFEHGPKSDNLGACFVGFLKYYGLDFDLRTQRIQMHPPAIVRKTSRGIDGRPERPDGLSIQDPNLPENNISGGSHKAHEVFKAFASGYRTINDTIAQRTPGMSLLECILGGDYTTYVEQRNHMNNLK
jgi:non-canonical poly(A) RNA polymerase PAPD5/7